jgi:hypothetical protein
MCTVVMDEKHIKMGWMRRRPRSSGSSRQRHLPGRTHTLVGVNSFGKWEGNNRIVVIARLDLGIKGPARLKYDGHLDLELR